MIPEVILTCSNQGLESFPRICRDVSVKICVAENIKKSKTGTDQQLGSMLFDFTGEDIYHLAEQAKDLGIDMVVLDDGWFGSRNDDNSGLGDWKVNEKNAAGKSW